MLEAVEWNVGGCGMEGLGGRAEVWWFGGLDGMGLWLRKINKAAKVLNRRLGGLR